MADSNRPNTYNSGKETTRRKKEGSGKHCVVLGCKNNSRKLRKWKLSTCELHAPETHEFCVCLQPYQMHRFPSCSNINSVAIRTQWVNNINRKDFTPAKYSTVCSIHFIEGRPTSSHPYPTLVLGYDPITKTPTVKPTPRKQCSTTRRPTKLQIKVPAVPAKLKCSESVDTKAVDSIQSTATHTEECVIRNASSQWYDAMIADHGYARTNPAFKAQPSSTKPTRLQKSRQLALKKLLDNFTDGLT